MLFEAGLGVTRLIIHAARTECQARLGSASLNPSAHPRRHNDGIDKQTGDAVISVAARDHFPGHSPVRFGVGEFIDLSVLSADVTPAAGLRWFIESDASGGTLINNTATNAGTALYTAGHTAGAVTLVLKVLSGPEAGATVAKTTITVVTPTDAVMRQRPGSHIFHNKGTWSVGFKGNIFFRPTDVSFKNITFEEGTATAAADGYLSVYNGRVHPIGPVITVGKGNARTGSQLNGIDTVSNFGLGPPYAIGRFLWPIPWRFGVRVPSPGMPPSDSSVFTTANHFATADATGRATIKKKGAGPFSAMPDDPTSGF
jgi:hypothetical protein